MPLMDEIYFVDGLLAIADSCRKGQGQAHFEELMLLQLLLGGAASRR